MKFAHALAVFILLSVLSNASGEPRLQDYARPGELDPLPELGASLYKVPWRANPRTASAFDALAGIGVYYKHIPNEWTLEQNIAVMKQLAATGVRRLRIAPHHAIYITKDWKAPTEQELTVLRNHLRACKAAGIRPCVIFVHIPPVGKPGTRELQEWWRQGELMPVGEVGSAEFNAYLEKNWEALVFIVNEARAAGFAEPGSYDLEMGQNLWWGGPAAPRPFPSTDVTALRPGGRIYEFDRALCQRLRKAGYVEPTLWWSETYHYFDQCRDDEVPSECVGRAISMYSAYTGRTPEDWLTKTQYDKTLGPLDTWPVRSRLNFLEGAPPSLVLARPESYMADRTRHDNLIPLLKQPVAITSLGVVPSSIPDAKSGGLDGWQMKSRGLTRLLAFWLNQGVKYVLLHSAYEGGQQDRGEMSHSLIPTEIDPLKFQWQDAVPLVALKSFCDGLEGAKPIANPKHLLFEFALRPDPEIIPASVKHQALRASDAVALLPFQIDEKRFAIAAYVVSPNVSRPMKPMRMTLHMYGNVTIATTIRPSTQSHGDVELRRRGGKITETWMDFNVQDDVTWVKVTIE